MKQAKHSGRAGIVIRTLALLLVLVLLAVFFFGFSDYSYTEKEPLFDAPNLAVAQGVQATSAQGASTAARLIDGSAQTAWRAGSRTGEILIDFGAPVTFNTVILREKGWNIKDYTLYISTGTDENGNDRWDRIYCQDKIEDYRLCTFDSVTTNRLRLAVERSNAPFQLLELEVYNVAPVENHSFTACAYLSAENCALGALSGDENDKNWLDPQYFDVYGRITLIGSGGLEDETGEISLSETPDGQSTYFETALQRVRAAAGEHDPEIFYSGSWGGDKVFEEPLRSQAIQNVLDFLIRYDLDGFDFDWEFPTSHEQFEQLCEFVVEMKKAFAPYGKKISMAWYAWDISLSSEAVQAIDYLNIMGYDEYDQDGNICSFMSGALQPVQYFLDMGFAPQQIVLGMPLYARAYINGALVERRIEDPDVALTRFVNESDGFVFNDPQLIADKTAYAIYEGLGGVFVWTLLSDTPMESDNNMSRVIGQTMQQRLLTEEVAP